MPGPRSSVVATAHRVGDRGQGDQAADRSQDDAPILRFFGGCGGGGCGPKPPVDGGMGGSGAPSWRPLAVAIGVVRRLVRGLRDGIVGRHEWFPFCRFASGVNGVSSGPVPRRPSDFSDKRVIWGCPNSVASYAISKIEVPFVTKAGWKTRILPLRVDICTAIPPP